MKNAQYNTLDVKRTCEKKLNITFRPGGELNGWFELGGKRVARVTIPKGRKPIPPKTYKNMAFQLKLSIEQFDDLLDCPLDMDGYVHLLRQQGY